MADAAPPSPAMLPPSDSAPLLPPADAPTPDAAARTPNLPDTPASAADPETPFSDAATPSDADFSALAPPYLAAVDDALEDDGINDPSGAARKHMTLAPPAPPSKKSKKKGSCVWTRPNSRKGKKKAKQPGHAVSGGASGASRPKPSCGEDEFLLTPAPRLAADRNDDGPDLPILLSRVYRSEKIEVSEDRLTASGTKGYRMVRATRGVASGAWYFEVTVLRIPPQGGTRLGWATNKADIQTPVGCDGFGFSYRSVDGTKVSKAWRADYAEEYKEGDVIGFYISLPQGELYEPKQPDLVKYKGMPFHAQPLKDEKKTPDPVPGEQSLLIMCNNYALILGQINIVHLRNSFIHSIVL
jgi:Set1/Ash2 histone methyltransferase complex subunit ASH2